MRKIFQWGVKASVAMMVVAGAEVATGGDPILFFSTDQLSSAPVKQFDRELVKIIGTPDAVDPTQAAYAATARERRGPRRSDARRLALMKKRQRAEANWLVEEPSEGGESAGNLAGMEAEGESIDEYEILYGPDEPELNGGWEAAAGSEPSSVDQSEMIRAARLRASRAAAQAEAVVRSGSSDLSSRLDLRALMASEGAGTSQPMLRGGGIGLGGGSLFDSSLSSRPGFDSPGGSPVPGRFQPGVQSPSFSAGPGFNLRDRLGMGSSGTERSRVTPNQATYTDWGSGASLNGLEQRYQRATQEGQRAPSAPEHEKWRRLGR